MKGNISQGYSALIKGCFNGFCVKRFYEFWLNYCTPVPLMRRTMININKDKGTVVCTFTVPTVPKGCNF